MRWIGLAVAVTCFLGWATAQGAVEKIEVTERGPFADGASFGDVGPYEKIRGIAFFALDPSTSANAPIVDLKNAPRDARGRVLFQSPFLMLRPKRAAASTLIYDVNNRGSIVILGQVNGRSPVNNDPTTLADAGDGFLMRHGFTLLFSAWTWDVAPQPVGVKPLVMVPPVAHGPGGQPISGLIENEFTVTEEVAVATYAGMRGITYEPTVPNDPNAVLTERARPDDARRPIERSRWTFTDPAQPGGPGRIALQGGFKPGVLYELTYTSKDPYVTGAGLAGVRDLLAWFRDHPFEGTPPPGKTLIFGVSQSGRLIGRMLHDGLDVDEAGKLVFDGAFMVVPGAGGSAGFNSRFAQPTRHPSMLEEHDYPADFFPFTSSPSRDPVTGRTASTLDHAADAQGHRPRLMVANTSTEFWNRDASLIATTPDGASDVAPAEGVRIYGLMGAQHYVGRSTTRTPFTNCVSTTDHYLVMRSLILALERWVGKGEAPPASAYPRLSDGTLVTVDTYRDLFPKHLPISPPVAPLAEPRLDFGSGFEKTGIATTIPPVHGLPFGTRVPAPDRDGNDQGGVRLIELKVPLGTHTGWNPRAPETGFPWATARFDGSFLPFARTEAEREAMNDPRPSLAARYATRADLEQKLRTAAAEAVAAGFLLTEDVERAVSENLSLYDRILGHDPQDASCQYLITK